MEPTEPIVCRDCLEPKAPSEFSADKRRRNGLQSYCKECMAARTRRYYAQNSEVERQKQAEWQKNNPEYMSLVKRRRYNSKKAVIAQNGTHTQEEWAAVVAQQNDCCAACGQRGPLERDHIRPLTAGGTDTIDNIQGLCRSCNSRKYTKTIDYRRAA